jgi:hypothetical protein
MIAKIMLPCYTSENEQSIIIFECEILFWVILNDAGEIYVMLEVIKIALNISDISHSSSSHEWCVWERAAERDKKIRNDHASDILGIIWYFIIFELDSWTTDVK